MHLEITDHFLQTLIPPVSGRIEIRDSRAPGLTLRVTPQGVCSWCVRRRTALGRETRPTLGHWPEVSIREARKLALVALGDIAAGGDPVAAKRATRTARRAQQALPTVATRLTEWRHARGSDWSQRYSSEVERLCTKIIVPQIGSRPLELTTRADWVDLIRAERDARPGTASWLYGVISSFANFAEASGWVAQPLLPRKGAAVIAPKLAPRRRTLDDGELVAVWHSAGQRQPRVRAFVHLLVLTGCRVGEAAGIRFGELDPVRGRWSILPTRTKNRVGITVPIPPPLLGELLALAPGDAHPDHCLLGARPQRPLQAITRVKEALDKASGVKAWRLHDLRRSVRSGLARIGVSNEIAELCLNHVSGRSQLERTYNTHDYALEILAALGQWQAYVAELVKSQEVSQAAA